MCHTEHVRDLSNLRRRSACCHADVKHPLPWDTHDLADSLSLTCTHCGKDATLFEVVTGDGEVIWPLPDNFEVPPDHVFAIEFLGDGSRFVYVSHLLRR
jgi:hypothetical protein